MFKFFSKEKKSIKYKNVPPLSCGGDDKSCLLILHQENLIFLWGTTISHAHLLFGYQKSENCELQGDVLGGAHYNIDANGKITRFYGDSVEYGPIPKKYWSDILKNFNLQ